MTKGLNEKETENIVRTQLYRDNFFNNNKVIVEEKTSKNTKINKLLENASKSGNGKGYPEFIIQYHENTHLIIVIECKSDIAKHESQNRKHYKDYAVDGVLLYSSFLAKEYDVISIAVSGNQKRKKISHFLQLKGTQQAYNIFNDDNFLSLKDYLNGYKTDERKFNQDFQELLKYSRTLNDKLHSLKVPESNRSLLISGILIALNDKAFYNAYKYQKAKSLSENLVNTIKNKLTEIQNRNIEDIITSYSFITTHTILSKQENKLKGIIESVDKEINNFIKTYKYFDTLGQFYIEFLRYANNDKGLGIVLTPPHITELFCDIANINKDSIVLDTCTGTGGFLISAMKKMIIDAGRNKEKEQNIKLKQIIGIELQDSIFSLTCSNMYIHGDGRSNLIKGDCFDKEVIAQVKKYKPNVGFLNPPYKTKKDDTDEFEFILNSLSMLEKGSYCVAIIPMSCMLIEKGEVLELKENLLKNHTLEAVFSMPNELFYNSNISVATCIIVLKTKEKHPSNYKTYFGIWNNDGFLKIKNIGRTDFDCKWELIKKTWIENYRNKEEMTGHSIKQVVTKDDEWLSENYIKIDYSKIGKIDFENFLLKYIGNLFLLSKIDRVNKSSKIEKFIDLKEKHFRYFNLTGETGLFDIKKGERLNKNLRAEGTIPLLTSTSLNNGIADFIDYDYFKDSKKVFKNKITIDMLSNVFYHGYEYFSDDNIHTLILKDKYKLGDNQYIYLFIATLLKKISIRYSYGRQVRLKRLENETISLPVNNNQPDWQFMEDYIKSLTYSDNL